MDINFCLFQVRFKRHHLLIVVGLFTLCYNMLISQHKVSESHTESTFNNTNFLLYRIKKSRILPCAALSSSSSSSSFSSTSSSSSSSPPSLSSLSGAEEEKGSPVISSYNKFVYSLSQLFIAAILGFTNYYTTSGSAKGHLKKL